MIKEIKKALTLLDNYLFTHVHPYVTEVNTNIMLFITFFGSHNFLLPANILLALYLLMIRKDRWSGIKVIVISLTSVLLMFSLKYYFRRVRPIHPVHEAASGYSFPSGHSMSSMTFYGLIIYLVVTKMENVKARWACAVFLALVILAIGFSRIYLRVHYASDVLGGYVIGFTWLLVSLWLLNTLEKRSMHGKM